MITISSNLYKIENSDINHIKVDCTSSASKIFLPKASNNANKSITIYKKDTSANAITIHTDGDTLYDATLQVETATVVGTISSEGNVTVVLTAANCDNSPITLSIPVLVGETATQVATKIKAAFLANSDISAVFSISGSGANVVITNKYYYANDSTLNISIDNGSCAGLTTAATSTNTTSGVSVTISTQNAWKTFISNGVEWSIIDSGGVNETETLVNKTLTAPKIANNGYISDANGNELIKCTTTTSAVNEITVTNAATTNNPTISSTGGDTNIGLTLSTKGNGFVDFPINVIASENLALGDLVYISGYDTTSAKLKVSKADADVSPALWVVAATPLDQDTAGIVSSVYELTGQNTNSASAVGDPVYLSATAGGWTLTAPSTGGQIIQQIGVVTVKHASTGKVLLMPFYSKSYSVNSTE